MEIRCIQDTKQCGKRHFFGKRGVFPGREEFEGEKKDKRKAPDFSDAVAIFCGI